MKKFFVFFCLASLTAILFGCAGMINGKTQMINVDSNVKGAEVQFIKGDGTTINLGATPFVGPIPRGKGGGRIVVKKAGYAEKQQIVETKMSLVFLLNFFIPSGTFSSTTDISNETMWEYAPSNYFINLETASSSIDFKKDTEIKRFVMMNYPQVVDDLARAEGKYLDALVFEIFRTAPEQASAVVADLRELLRTGERSVVAFGMKASEYYFAKQKT